MLHGMVANPLTSRDMVLAAMQASDATFYLTGSQYFGTAMKTSDYDFFTLDSYATREMLHKLGFTSSYAFYGYSTDRNLVDVYRHEAGIDVQFVANEKLRLAMQHVVQTWGNVKSLSDKPQACQIWTKAYETVMALRPLLSA